MNAKNYDNLYKFITAGRSKNSRTLENNTTARLDNEHIIIKFHNTDIMEIFPDNTTILNSGGYKTHTTKDRINKYLPEGFVLYQEKGLWFISYKWQQTYLFADGMIINPDLTVTGSGVNQKELLKLRSDIRKYAKGFITALLAGKVKKPYAGDCFYCHMRGVESHKPLGEITKDTKHLLSHFDKKYFVGSLLYRAVELYPVSIAGQSVLYDLWENNTAPDKWFMDIAREQLYKSLVKYLSAQFGLTH